MLAFGAVVGSSAFFITHGFKRYAEEQEARLLSGEAHMSDIGKILYLEVIDLTFSIDGVVGAFAFTLSVPLILLGNGIGAIVVRQLTVYGVDRIKKYVYLKNGAMYSVFVLGCVMIAHGFGIHIPGVARPRGDVLHRRLLLPQIPLAGQESQGLASSILLFPLSMTWHSPAAAYRNIGRQRQQTIYFNTVTVEIKNFLILEHIF